MQTEFQSTQANFEQPTETQYIVGLEARGGGVVAWMASGIRNNEKRSGRGRANFCHTTDRTRAQRLPKATAELLANRVRNEWRMMPVVEAE